LNELGGSRFLLEDIILTVHMINDIDEAVDPVPVSPEEVSP
jgi:hypothetical protein